MQIDTDKALEDANTVQASSVMDMRAKGWQLEDAYPYTYEDEEHIDMPVRIMFMLIKGERTAFINEAGTVLYQVTES